MTCCADKKDVHQCHKWADEGQCDINPTAVMKDCPSTCGLCTSSCKDHDKGCKGWAMAKLCGEQPAFMNRVCPASCGICNYLNNKDEL